MTRRLAALLVSFGLCVSPLVAQAATTINGEYQLMMELRKSFRAYPWDWDSNDDATGTPARFWIVSTPASGAEVFFKVVADWRRNDNQSDRPDFQYDQAHIKYRREKGKHGFETMLFSREDRFWTNRYLIPFVNGRGDAQGIRLDTWGFAGTELTLIAADQSSQLDPQDAINKAYGGRLFPQGNAPYPIGPIAPVDSLLAQRKLRTDDMYVARLRRSFFKGGPLKAGFTLNRSESWSGRDSINSSKLWNSVFGFDTRFHFTKGPSFIRDADMAVEYGQSGPVMNNLINPQLTFFREPTKIRLSDRSVAQAEFRSIKVGTPRIGYLNVTPGWWMRGPAYQNNMGGPGSDETGFIIQSYYLLPERAITYSNQLLWYGKKAESRNKTREVYNELYIEFLNGFNGKTAYRRREDYQQRGPYMVRTPHNSWTNELQVESRLAWMRFQSKLQDIGRPEAKQLFVIEERLNLTDRMKIFNRFALGNDPSILRKAIFTQLQYQPTSNMEMFLQYGPDDIGGGSNPVEDGNLAGSGDQSDVFKFILKGNF